MFDFDSPADPDDARHRLADATRQIIDQLASSTATSAAFEEARDLVVRAADLLAELGHGRGYEGAEASLAEFAGRRAFVDDSPFLGRLNPLAAPIRISIDHGDGTDPEDRTAHVVHGVATFGAAYEGPPGCVHGGVIAGGFDEVLGLAQALSGSPGMTGKLEITYRSPTPLHREVRYTARLDRIDGRKLFASATLHAGDVLCASATGLFISMRPGTFDEMMRERNAR